MGREGSGQVQVCQVRSGSTAEEEAGGGREAELALEEHAGSHSQVNSLAPRSPEGRDAENPLHHGASLSQMLAWNVLSTRPVVELAQGVFPQPSWDRSLPAGGRGQAASLNPALVQGPKATGPAQA